MVHFQCRFSVDAHRAKVALGPAEIALDHGISKSRRLIRKRGCGRRPTGHNVVARRKDLRTVQLIKIRHVPIADIAEFEIGIRAQACQARRIRVQRAAEPG